MSFVIPVIGLGPVRYLFEESIRAELFLNVSSDGSKRAKKRMQFLPETDHPLNTAIGLIYGLARHSNF